jgi:hypothetical protein
MAKLKDDPAVQALMSKAAADAVKAEKKRVAAGLKALALPEGTTARAGAEIKKAIKTALA